MVQIISVYIVQKCTAKSFNHYFTFACEAINWYPYWDSSAVHRWSWHSQGPIDGHGNPRGAIDGHGNPRGAIDGHGNPMAPIPGQRWFSDSPSLIMEKFPTKKIRSSWDLTCSCGVYIKQSHSNMLFLQEAANVPEKCWKTFTVAFVSDSRC